MTWIKVIEEDEATGHIAEYYKKAREEGRRVSNIHKASSLNPLAMEGHMALYRSVHKGASPISRLNREMIAVTVSGINGCHY